MGLADVRQQEHEARWCDSAAELPDPAAVLSALLGAAGQRPEPAAAHAPGGGGGQVNPQNSLSLVPWL